MVNHENSLLHLLGTSTNLFETKDSLDIDVNIFLSFGENESNLTNDIEPWNFGPPSYVCNHCGAVLWYEERSVKSKRPRNPKFSVLYGG